MINTLKHGAALVRYAAAYLQVATPALSQAPTEAQRKPSSPNAAPIIMAHCASIPPGGEASLQCLQKNMSSLSSGCQSAVRAVEAGGGAEGRDRAGRSAQGRARAAPLRPRSPRPQLRQAAPSAAAKQADRCAGGRDPQRLPLRLSKGLRRRADRRRSGAAMPGKEQGEGFGGLRQAVTAASGGAAAHRPRRRCGPAAAARRGARRDRAAADAAARRIVGVAVGMQRRRSHAVRRRCARRRPHHAVPRRRRPPRSRRPARTCWRQFAAQ